MKKLLILLVMLGFSGTFCFAADVPPAAQVKDVKKKEVKVQVKKPVKHILKENKKK